MKVIVNLEQIFQKTPDGRIWGPGYYSENYWNGYLDVFEEVKIIARIKTVNWVENQLREINQIKIRFIKVPYYQGPWGFCKRLIKIVNRIRNSLRSEDAVIMTAPSAVSSLLGAFLILTHHPYGVRVVGDPQEVFSKRNVNSPLDPLFQWFFTRSQRKICAHAYGVAYVTRSTLQKKYPCKRAEFGISDVDIGFWTGNRKIDRYSAKASSDQSGITYCSQIQNKYYGQKNKFSIITIGSMDQMYKGIDDLISATYRLISIGFDIQLKIIGDGKYREKMESIGQKFKIMNRIHFLGTIEYGEKVLEELKTADIFVLASRTEGLPRALIEGMSVGLPCLGSDVGGIPELLDKEDVFPSNNIEALTRKLSEVITEKGRLEKMSARNLKKSLEFSKEKLNKDWAEFFSHIRKGTEDWVRKNRK